MKPLLFIAIILSLSACGDLPENQQYDEIHAILSDFSAQHWHGSADHGLSRQQRLEKHLRGDRLSLTCGPLHSVAREVLALNGFTSRVVTSVTLDDLNGFSDGHTVIEVFHPDLSRWIMYDLSFNRQPLIDGRGISMVELVDAVRNGEEYGFLQIAFTEPMDPGFSYYNPRTDETLKEDYSRWFQLARMSTGGASYFIDGPYSNRAMELWGYQPMPRDEFMDLFYPEQSK